MCLFGHPQPHAQGPKRRRRSFHKDAAQTIRDFVDGIVPELDHDRVYQSDLKKLVQWYNILVAKGAFPLEAPETAEDKAEDGSAEEKEASSQKTRDEKGRGKEACEESRRQRRLSMNVTVIGAGTMGNGIAHVFAQSGHDVVMMDRSAEALERALATIGKNMDRMVAKEKISAADKDAALARLTTSTDLASAVSNAGLVVEAATENIDLKLAIFGDLDKAAPEGCILATNTSSISITRICRDRSSRQRHRHAFHESCARDEAC